MRSRPCLYGNHNALGVYCPSQDGRVVAIVGMNTVSGNIG